MWGLLIAGHRVPTGGMCDKKVARACPTLEVPFAKPCALTTAYGMSIIISAHAKHHLGQELTAVWPAQGKAICRPMQGVVCAMTSTVVVYVRQHALGEGHVPVHFIQGRANASTLSVGTIAKSRAVAKVYLSQPFPSHFLEMRSRFAPGNRSSDVPRQHLALVSMIKVM